MQSTSSLPRTPVPMAHTTIEGNSETHTTAPNTGDLCVLGLQQVEILCLIRGHLFSFVTLPNAGDVLTFGAVAHFLIGKPGTPRTTDTHNTTAHPLQVSKSVGDGWAVLLGFDEAQ